MVIYAMTAATLSKLKQIAFVVHDVDAMTTFYENIVGIKKLFAVPGMSFFDLDGVRLMLSRPTSDAFDKGNSVLYFAVNRIEEKTKLLQLRGVEFEREPFMVARMPDHEFWLAFFRDPENNVLALAEEKPLA